MHARLAKEYFAHDCGAWIAVMNADEYHILENVLNINITFLFESIECSDVILDSIGPQ